jgi:4-azaleucine resistance transporter AzlC
VNDVRVALRDTFPVAMGYIPLGMAYGLLLVQSGLPWYVAPISSVAVFAGAMQFLSVGLLAAGTPLAAIALATFAVNFRHVFYGLSFPLGRLQTPAQRWYGIFALTDETYSLLAGRPADELGGRRIHLIQLFSHGYWVLGGTVGALASVAMPTAINGIDFALTALFVVLALEHGRRSRNLTPVAMGALSCAVAFGVGGGQFLSVAMGTFLVLAIALFFVKRKEVSDDPDVPAGRGGGDGGGDVRAARGAVSGAA